jgi:ubiquinone/menaquinone biosynthesis C-methylase UbiE
MEIITHGLRGKGISDSGYTRMQLQHYQSHAAEWSLAKKNLVVGLFDEHNESSIYDVMIEGFDTSNMKMLDFGCGPGRNIVKLSDKFKEIDGVDIASRNLENAKLWIETNEEKFRPDQTINLYECNGTDLSLIEGATYDMVYSTIVLQHIPVHELRLDYFKEFFRVLKPGGWISLQMGYGLGPRSDAITKKYHENAWGVRETNGRCDVSIDNVDDLQKDIIETVGFKNFSHSLSTPIPENCETHTHWIYFRAQK